jgi:selenide, water dikinase
VLRELQGQKDDRLLVGPLTYDDAGVVVLGEGEGLPRGSRIGLVQTVDFFPPVVDDPWYYGAIAAANALSDVYAMGGRPISALNIAGFPKDFPAEWIAAILRGGYAKIAESGAVVAGGHTVQSAVQFGFAVTGIVDPERVASNDRARAGELAYLTKPIGMGCFTTAAKKKVISWSELEPAARQMATLNDRAAAAMSEAGAGACTDITGFGLIGHAFNIARASRVTLRIEAGRVPLFPGAFELARKGLFSGGAKRGRANLQGEYALAGGLDEALVGLLFDAETSGGLLIAIAPERAPALERALAACDLPVACIGRFVSRGEHAIDVV